jgi:hypothetical protein
MNFRIRKGTHVSHFHRDCPLWPAEDYYEQERPLWWGNLCKACARLADVARASKPSDEKPAPAAESPAG